MSASKTRFYARSVTVQMGSDSAQQQILFTKRGRIKTVRFVVEDDTPGQRAAMHVDIFYNGSDHFATDGTAPVFVPVEGIQQAGAPPVRYERNVGSGVTMGVVFRNTDLAADMTGTVVFEVEEFDD